MTLLSTIALFVATAVAEIVGCYLPLLRGTCTWPSRQQFCSKMCGVFAEFDRAMIVERFKAGLARRGNKASGWAGPGCLRKSRRTSARRARRVSV
jgi:hypothetical protein